MFCTNLQKCGLAFSKLRIIGVNKYLDYPASAFGQAAVMLKQVQPTVLLPLLRIAAPPTARRQARHLHLYALAQSAVQ